MVRVGFYGAKLRSSITQKSFAYLLAGEPKLKETKFWKFLEVNNKHYTADLTNIKRGHKAARGCLIVILAGE